MNIDPLRVTREQALSSRNGARESAKDIIIFVTDGFANINAEGVEPEVRRLRDLGNTCSRMHQDDSHYLFIVLTGY